MQNVTITAQEAGQRLDKLLGKYLDQAPKSFLYKMMRKKNITLNGRKCTGSERLAAGDVIRLFLSDDTISGFSSSAGKKASAYSAASLKQEWILYEDDQILLINKPVGMLSQKAKKGDISAVELLTAYMIESGQLSEQTLHIFRPGVCNRLDRNTSGILAAGKTTAALQELNRFFKERTIKKYYLCLVDGVLLDGGHLEGYLVKDSATNKVQILQEEVPGSTRIETEYRPVRTGADVTLLEVHLITGKTHQIRAHLASIGHPLIGDYKYGNFCVNNFYKAEYNLETQLLHAYRLVMPDSDGRLSYLSGCKFTAEPPALFCDICRNKGVM